MTDSDRDELAKVIHDATHNCFHAHGDKSCEAWAYIILASPWLTDHVRAKQAEAVASVAWEIASSPSLRLGHNVSVVCSCLRCEVATGAARIASDRADRLRDGEGS